MSTNRWVLKGLMLFTLFFFLCFLIPDDVFCQGGRRNFFRQQGIQVILGTRQPDVPITDIAVALGHVSDPHGTRAPAHAAAQHVEKHCGRSHGRHDRRHAVPEPRIRRPR